MNLTYIKSFKTPLAAFILATAVTATMDFTGYLQFSALPLILITAIFWLILRLTKKEMGLTLGNISHYGLALLYPFVVLGAMALIASLTGNISIEELDVSKSITMIGIGSTVGIIMVLLTEEGFFRGWLWGAFKRLGLSTQQTLYVTTFLFVLWHISAVTSGTDYGLPLYQIPVYLVNATFLGLIWGILRDMSGSVVVASVCHAVWNGLAYQLYGFGEKSGDLGISNTIVFGPEVGILGIFLNGVFLIWLYKKWKKQAVVE